MISRVVIVQSVVCFHHELVILFSGCFWSSLSVASIKSNKVSDIFYLQATCIMPCMILALSMIFHLLTFFCNLVIFLFSQCL